MPRVELYTLKHSCSSWNSRTTGRAADPGSLGAPRGRARAARATMHERTSLASCSFRNTNDFSRKRTLEIEFRNTTEYEHNMDHKALSTM